MNLVLQMCFGLNGHNLCHVRVRSVAEVYPLVFAVQTPTQVTTSWPQSFHAPLILWQQMPAVLGHHDDVAVAAFGPLITPPTGQTAVHLVWRYFCSEPVWRRLMARPQISRLSLERNPTQPHRSQLSALGCTVGHCPCVWQAGPDMCVTPEKRSRGRCALRFPDFPNTANASNLLSVF